jgi:putative RNA 2'-phosphotransferase
MSLVLRHKPEIIGITLDDAGWVVVDALLVAMKTQRCSLTLEQFEDIVSNNDKQRFCFNDDQCKLRANQGHSLLFVIRRRSG